MTDMQQDRTAATGPAYGREPEMTRWVGWIIFAGVMMFLIGCFSAINGLIGIFKDEYYVVGDNDLVVSIDYTAWGWAHLLLGILIALTGIGAMAGQTWARAVGVVLVTLNAIVNFAFLAAYPVWSTIVITLDVFVIYALIVHGREARGLR